MVFFRAFALCLSLCLLVSTQAVATGPQPLTPCQLLLMDAERLQQRLEKNVLAYSTRIRLSGNRIELVGVDGGRVSISEMLPEIDKVFGTEIRNFPHFFSFYYESLVFFFGNGLDRWKLDRSTAQVFGGISLLASSSKPANSLLGDEVSVSFNTHTDPRVHAVTSVDLTLRHRDPIDSAVLEAAIQAAGDLVRKDVPEFGALMTKRTEATRIDLKLLPGVFGPEPVDKFLHEVEWQLWNNEKYRPNFQRRPLVRIISSVGDQHTLEVLKKPDWQK